MKLQVRGGRTASTRRRHGPRSSTPMLWRSPTASSFLEAKGRCRGSEPSEGRSGVVAAGLIFGFYNGSSVMLRTHPVKPHEARSRRSARAAATAAPHDLVRGRYIAWSRWLHKLSEGSQARKSSAGRRRRCRRHREERPSGLPWTVRAGPPTGSRHGGAGRRRAPAGRSAARQRRLIARKRPSRTGIGFGATSAA